MESIDEQLKGKSVYRLTLPFEDYESLCVSAEVNLEFNVTISQPIEINEAAKIPIFKTNSINTLKIILNSR